MWCALPYNLFSSHESPKMKLTPHFQSQFEVFRDEEGNQYARMHMADSYEWFKYDFWNETYVLQSFTKELEKAYQNR